MKWEMHFVEEEEEEEKTDPMQEKIWDLHDKLSDAIHSVSRAHYLRSRHVSLPRTNGPDHGFVFSKEFPHSSSSYVEASVREAKSLNGIRAALENLEDQLHFFHTVQVQQRAERDAAIARLEQSRIFLAQRLSEHHGKNFKVIEEALEFVGDASQFVSTNFTSAPCPSGKKSVPDKGIRLNLIKVISMFGFGKKSLKVNEMGGVLGNAALVALSMLALLHFHQTGSKDKYVLGLPEENAFYNKNVRRIYRSEDSPLNNRSAQLDVNLARG